MANNEITKYSPKLNTIPLKKFTATEMNLFFSIISKMRDRKDETVRFTFSKLKDLSEYKPTANKRFVNDLRKTYKKILDLKFIDQNANGLDETVFVLFSKFTIRGTADEPYVDIKIYEEALPLLNNLEEWVRYSLHEFNNINSTYAKTAFRLLKQYRTTGFAYFKKDEFRELMDIPKSYSNAEVTRTVLKTIQKNLDEFFEDLTITPIHKKGRGNPIAAYQFTFKPEERKQDDFNFKENTTNQPAKATHQEIATDWSKKKAVQTTAVNHQLDDILTQIDEVHA
ncbi:replication initiation protein [Holzapfeliella sp. JNUCC 72]